MNYGTEMKLTTTRTQIFAIAVIVILAVSLSAVAIYFLTSRSGNGFSRLARIACIGDSITQSTVYPSDLQIMLRQNSTVGNFGVSGATVVSTAATPYITQPAMQAAKDFQPTTVIIMLGTNDARGDVYKSINSYTADYNQIIGEFKSLSSSPQIFLVKPPPLFGNDYDLNNTNLSEGIIPRIEQVAAANGLTTIDVYSRLAGHSEFFPDGVHPNNAGSKAIADVIYQGITS